MFIHQLLLADEDVRRVRVSSLVWYNEPEEPEG